MIINIKPKNEYYKVSHELNKHLLEYCLIFRKEDTKKVNNRYFTRCVQPQKHNNNDDNYSMAILDNCCYCQTCKEKFFIDNLIAYDNNISKNEAQQLAVSFFTDKLINNQDLKVNSLASEQKQATKKEDQQLFNEFKEELFYMNNHEDVKAKVKNYFLQRGFSEEFIKFAFSYNFIAYNKNYNAVSFYFGGATTKRYLTPKNESQRYYNCWNSYKPFDLLNAITQDYNKDYLYKTNIILTEAIFDSLSIVDVIINNNLQSFKPLSMNSTNYLTQFKNYIMKHKLENKVNFILALDQDESGRNATRELINFFKANNISFIVPSQHLALNYKDLNEALLNNRKQFEEELIKLNNELANNKVKIA